MTQPVQNPNVTPVAEQPPPKLFAVALLIGEMWQLGGYVPGSEATLSRGSNPQDPTTYGMEIQGTEGREALRIIDMIPNDDGSVEVFAAPIPGSEFDRQQTACVFTLYPATIQRTLTVARFDVWKEMLAEANAPDEDEEEEEEEEPQVAGALPVANGTVATTAGGAS